MHRRSVKITLLESGPGRLWVAPIWVRIRILAIALMCEPREMHLIIQRNPLCGPSCFTSAPIFPPAISVSTLIRTSWISLSSTTAQSFTTITSICTRGVWAPSFRSYGRGYCVHLHHLGWRISVEAEQWARTQGGYQRGSCNHAQDRQQVSEQRQHLVWHFRFVAFDSPFYLLWFWG